MGLITSRDQTMLDGPVGTTKNHHVRQPSTRNRTKPPMPDRDELESRFIKVLDEYSASCILECVLFNNELSRWLLVTVGRLPLLFHHLVHFNTLSW
ncbi:unnamed protein product [Danaus chrysippus]|uniref:(African queen) hypothetical protein n=1 Tax=Danaus chrysippus TaxID=151541 RepID=A0A8J2VZV7_9NEOP|nr:unnamed protein product [Danaus chrysippus]